MITSVVATVCAVLLVIASLGFWASSLVGMPGNWLILALAAIFAYAVPSEYRVDIGWPVLVGLLLLAIVGEVVEFIAGAAGAKQAGGSKRGAALALVGSLIGGVVGMFLGSIGMPIVGTIIGALLFASIGSLVGAVLGEQWKGRDLDKSLKVGHAAFWGRLLGTLGKIWFGCLMIVLLLIALVAG